VPAVTSRVSQCVVQDVLRIGSRGRDWSFNSSTTLRACPLPLPACAHQTRLPPPPPLLVVGRWDLPRVSADVPISISRIGFPTGRLNRSINSLPGVTGSSFDDAFSPFSLLNSFRGKFCFRLPAKSRVSSERLDRLFVTRLIASTCRS